MLSPLPLGLGLRYVRARQHQFFVSFISWVSLLGVCLGVAALITILSVMNGFEGELRNRLLALSAQATLPGPADAAALERLAGRARREPGVRRALPFIEVQGLIASGPALAAIALRGIAAADFGRGTPLHAAMQAGSLDTLVADSGHLALGRALAAQLQAEIGDTVTVLLPRLDGDGGLEPRIGAFTVTGVFEVGLADHDALTGFAALEDVERLAGRAATAGVQLFFADPFTAPRLAPVVARALGVGPARDWTVEHAAYFRAIRLEKTMMTVILLLIVSVAAFNIVASLVMVVAEKRNDIAILRTMGLSRGSVVATFVVQGTVIGWIGTAAGVALGVVLAYYAGDITPALEHWFGFQIFDADVYYITRLPSELRGADVALVAGTALALTQLATIYPARRAAATEPAEALRYE